MTASPRPWRVGTSIPRNIYDGSPEHASVDPAYSGPPGRDIGRMDTAADAALVVAAVNAYGEPTTIEADLRKGWKESERRRRIAAVVAAHHQERLVDGGRLVGQDQVDGAFAAVLAALNGSTDPTRLGISGCQLTEDKVAAVIASTSGEDGRG